MAQQERVIYINPIWNTKQIREISFDLVYSTREVLSTLIPELQVLDTELDPLEATEEIHRAFNLNKIPLDKKARWDNSERWAFKFFSDYSFRNTPLIMDNKIHGAREIVTGFSSVQDVLNYWWDVLTDLDGRLGRLEHNRGMNSLAVIDASYVDSRIVRFAAQGTYLTPPGSFTSVEN